MRIEDVFGQNHDFEEANALRAIRYSPHAESFRSISNKIQELASDLKIDYVRG